jgi:hypothetical protein
MMILDPEADPNHQVKEAEVAENRDLIQLIGNANRTFMDWTSPWVPVDTAYDHSSEREAWDKELSSTIFDLFSSRPIDFFSGTLIDRLSRFLNRAIVEPAWKEFAPKIDALNASGRLRRGDVETKVGEFLFGPNHRMKSYQHIRHALWLRRSLSKYVEVDPSQLQPRVNLSHGVLRKVSTVQQLKFALKYRAIPVMPEGWSPDVITAGIFEKLGLQGMFYFAQYLAAAAGSESAPFENLTYGQIEMLRGSGERGELLKCLSAGTDVDVENALRAYGNRIMSALATRSPLVRFCAGRAAKTIGGFAGGAAGAVVKAAASAITQTPPQLVGPISTLVGAVVGNYIAGRLQPSLHGFIAQSVEEGYSDHVLEHLKIATPTVTILRLNS